MARHRRILTPWWRSNPASTAIAVSAMLATASTTTGAALHLTPGTTQLFKDPDPTIPLAYLSAGSVVIHDDKRPALPAPATTPAISAPASPTDPPTGPHTLPTMVIAMRTVSPTTAPQPVGFGEKLAYLASLQKGKPYVYGADGPNSFDCSGLIHYVYQQLGRSVPRTAQAQYNASTKIPQADREVGDLIFFGTPGSIYHDGIYAGNNQMWVAPHAGAPVQLETIWTVNYHVGRL